MKQFEKIPIRKPNRSAFDLSHGKNLTMNMGHLVPVLCQEILPGDKFIVNTEMLMRLQPMLAPMMHRVNVYLHHFFVPKRIIWDEWETFIAGSKNGDVFPNFPKITGTDTQFKAWLAASTGTIKNKALMDYFGIPVQQYASELGQNQPAISQLPFRAYQQIYNDYYRDQNLSDEIPFSKSSLDISVSEAQKMADLCLMRKRAWEKDYFTAALPWAQRGESVKLPLGNSAPIFGTGSPIELTETDFITPAGGAISGVGGVLNDAVDETLYWKKKIVEGVESTPSLYADLTEATSTTINDLRRSYALQRWLEKTARGGYRYIEQILIHFGVKSSDSRLQRAEYLSGGKLPIVIGEVLQTSETETTPQGNMAGHGVSGGNVAGFTKFFEEHGFVISILSVIPRTAYMQGIPKMFMKFDRFDYYFPDFAHIGEQPVYKKELFLKSVDPAEGEKELGYNRRYAEYCYNQDSVHGDFRTNLDYWHMARKFDDSPSLNETFVMANPTHRVFAVEDENADKLLVQLFHKITAIRPVAKYGEPI